MRSKENGKKWREDEYMGTKGEDEQESKKWRGKEGKEIDIGTPDGGRPTEYSFSV